MNRGMRAMGRGLAGLLAAALVPALMLIPPALAARPRALPLQEQLRAHIAILASDDFQGREPGTEGESKTLRYLSREWFDMGLVSGTGDPGNEWFAPVRLVEREPAAMAAQFNRKGRPVSLLPDEGLVLTSGKRSMVRNAPLLFVGTATGALPGRNELAGRIAVLLDGPPPTAGAEPTSVRQNALLDAGADAVLTVLDDDRTLESVAARRQRSGYALASEALGGDLEAFVSVAGLDRILTGTGETIAGLQSEAGRGNFTPRVMPITGTLEATTRETTIRTHNLIGKLPGRRAGSGAVLFVAHWDHFGVCGVPPAEDVICNGAVDNASGVAALTEVARRLARGPQPERDIYFLATTAEELGLLGAHAFAENPPLPLDQIVAAFNIDTTALAPAGTPLAIVGRGMTPLDAQIELVARRERRRVVPGDAANAFVKRQDGWALIQHDIPAVMVSSAYADIPLLQRFFDGDYHRPSDDLKRPIELGGAAQDVEFLVALGRWFADPRRVPTRAKMPVRP